MTYTLENDQCRAAISSHGAELTSLQHNGLEYLWQAAPAYWGRHAPLLFPIVGKLPDDTYLHDGQVYRLSQHGFARDQEFQLIEQDGTRSLTFQLMHSAATLAVYPFEFELRVRYTLYGRKLTVGWHVRNPAASGREMLFSIGGHPAFNCPMQSGERFEDYLLEIGNPPQPLLRQVLRGGLRTGETQPVQLTDSPVTDDGEALPLTYDLFADDALVFADETAAFRGGNFSFVGLRRADGTGPWVQVRFPGFPYLGLWTKGPGAGFVCIEPWQGVASPVGPPQELRDKEGILTLQPSEAFDTSYTIEVG